MPRDRADVLTLLAATAQADAKARIPLISMSMGPLGAVTRMVGGVFGSALSFAVGAGSSAPGQMPIADLNAVYDRDPPRTAAAEDARPAVRIAVAGAGRVGKQHIAAIAANPECGCRRSSTPPRRPSTTRARCASRLRASLAELLAKDRPDGVVLATPNQAARRPGARMHRRRRADARREARGAHGRGGNASLRGGRSGRRSGAGRSPSPPQLDHGQGGRGHRERNAREDRRRRRHGAFLQARKRGLLRRCVRVAAAARRRSHPAQHDSRGRQPALAVRRDRVGAGVHVERHPPISGRGHGGYRVALRERRARHVHAVRHRGVGPELGAHVRRRSAFREWAHRQRRLLRRRRNLRLAVDSHDAPRSAIRRPPTSRGTRPSPGASSSSKSPTRWRARSRTSST